MKNLKKDIFKKKNGEKKSGNVNKERTMNDFLDNLANDQHQKMLREIAEDDLTPKKKDKKDEQELWERIDTGGASPGVWERGIISE